MTVRNELQKSVMINCHSWQLSSFFIWYLTITSFWTKDIISKERDSLRENMDEFLLVNIIVCKPRARTPSLGVVVDDESNTFSWCKNFAHTDHYITAAQLPNR